jgi:hypothetical protein
MRLLWLLLPLLPCGAARKDLVVSGSLERVMQHAITILRADGVFIDARLPDSRALQAAALQAKYKLGDQVEITCQPIAPVLDPETHLLRLLDLRKLRFPRAPKPAELARAVASRT